MLDLSAQPVASTTGRQPMAAVSTPHRCSHLPLVGGRQLLGRSNVLLGSQHWQQQSRGELCRWRRQAVVSEAATKKKPAKKQPSSKIPAALPGPYQQTLRQSFTVGGLGLHTGEYAYVRVCPAHAGEGRYFVRVPEGTNSDRFKMEEMVEIPRDQFGAMDHMLDAEDEALKVQLFSEYLRVSDRGDFEGTFGDYVDEAHADKAAQVFESEQASVKDEPVTPRGEGEAYVLASAEYAEDGLPHFTRLRSSNCEVSSVEHLLAGLEASGVDNARIEIEGGSEVPVLDGSTFGWCVEVERAGLRLASYGDRDKIRKVAYAPRDVVTVRDGDAFVQLMPGAQQCITAGVDHSADAPVVGKQWTTWCAADDDQAFKKGIAPARMFAPSVEYLKGLRRQGLIKGGTSEVSVIADGAQWRDITLVRFFDDEPSRHAVADLVGDLALLGVGGACGLPLGHVVSYRADHALRVRFVKALRAACSDDDLQPVG